MQRDPGTLVSQMRGDLAAILPDDEVLQRAKEAGVSLIKKIRRRERVFEDGTRELTTDVEIHDSQIAAKTLARVFGLEGSAEEPV